MINSMPSSLLVATIMTIICETASACEISYFEKNFLGFESSGFLNEPGYLNQQKKEEFLWSSANLSCEDNEAEIGEIKFTRNLRREFSSSRGWFIHDEVARYEEGKLTTVITDGTLGKPTGMISLQCISAIYERDGKASCDISDQFIYGSLKSFPSEGSERSCVYYAIVATEFGEIKFKRLANQCDEGLLIAHLDDFKKWMADIETATFFLTAKDRNKNGE